MLLAPITLIMVEIYRKKQKMHRITSMEVSVLNEKKNTATLKKWFVEVYFMPPSFHPKELRMLTFSHLFFHFLVIFSGIRENFASGFLNPGPWNRE